MRAILQSHRMASQIIDDLEDAFKKFSKWHGANPTDPESRELFTDHYKAYESAVGRAIRAGLLDHPKVADWIRGRRSIGDRATLRRYRLGLEAGIAPPIDEADLWIACQASDLIDRGLSLEAIRRQLIRKSVSAPNSVRDQINRRLQSKQNLQKRLAGLGMSTQK